MSSIVRICLFFLRRHGSKIHHKFFFSFAVIVMISTTFPVHESHVIVNGGKCHKEKRGEKKMWPQRKIKHNILLYCSNGRIDAFTAKRPFDVTPSLAKYDSGWKGWTRSDVSQLETQENYSSFKIRYTETKEYKPCSHRVCNAFFLDAVFNSVWVTVTNHTKIWATKTGKRPKK